MRRILLTLSLSIVVIVATLVVTNMYVSDKSMQTATHLNDIMLDNFRVEMDGDIVMTEQSVRCFLSGLQYVSVDDSNNIVVDEKHLREFRSDIHDNLLQFMKVNRYYASSMFIIDADINRQFYGQDGCYAPSISHGDTVLHNLAANYDFSRSAHYQQVKSQRKVLWCMPSSKSPVAGRFMTLYMPVVLSNRSPFGAFAISLDVEMINRKLQKHLPYGEVESAIFLADENNHIFAAYPGWVMDFKADYENALNRPTRDKHADGSLLFDYEGESYYGFSRIASQAPWTICTICRADRIYEEADHVKRIIFLTSLLGMLLMLLCCIVISRQIRKDLRKKAAAEDELRMAANVQMALLKPTSFTLTPQPSVPEHSLPRACRGEGHLSAQPSNLSAFSFQLSAQKTHLSALIQPAREAGGDLYDYVEKDGRLIFCIGDVSGKGMPAALFMTQVISLFRNAVRNFDDPAHIAAQINDVLSENNPDMTFCTAFIGVLSHNTLTYCNAGHNPPVILSPQPSQLSAFSSQLSAKPSQLSAFSSQLSANSPHFMSVKPNLALGLMGGYPYQSEVTRLDIGQSILLYTDGVTEAKNHAHNNYGEHRLLQAISQSPTDVIQAVLRDIHTFVANCEQSDDITMLHVTIHPS